MEKAQEDNSSSLIASLADDVNFAEEELKESRDSQCARRILVRTTFAFVEGVVFLYKQDSLELVKRGDIRCTEGEISLLKEKTYFLSDAGRAKDRLARLPLSSNLVFSFNIYMRGVSPGKRFPTDNVNWQLFKECILIRHRVTHPKTAGEIDVSDGEIKKLSKAFKWFYGEVLKIERDGYQLAKKRLVQAKERSRQTRLQWKKK